jgi:hypothetical protein
MGEEVKVYKVFMGKPEGKRPLERSRRRRENGIWMNLKEIDCEPGSSVSIVCGYGLDEQAIEIRSQAEAKGFSSSPDRLWSPPSLM